MLVEVAHSAKDPRQLTILRPQVLNTQQLNRDHVNTGHGEHSVRTRHAGAEPQHASGRISKHTHNTPIGIQVKLFHREDSHPVSFSTAVVDSHFLV